MSGKTEITAQQKAAVEKQGRVIVSASAGSGKTFVMIKRLTDLIIGGVSLDSVLAVTFTRKATAGMQEKLRSALIGAINSASDKETKSRLKDQLGKIPLADISTIHSFCSNLIRNYFYAADVSGDFTIVSTDDATGRGLFTEAMENIIEEGYAHLNEVEDFALLLKIFVRGGRDTSELEKTISEIYHKLRVTADYKTAALYFSDFSEERYNEIVNSLIASFSDECNGLLKRAEGVLPNAKGFPLDDCVKAKEYISAVSAAFKNTTPEGVTAALLSLSKPRKGTKKAGVSEADLYVREEISALKEAAADCAAEFTDYKFADSGEEKRKYLSSGKVAKALYNYAVKFDGEYTRLKREKACLDYGDLEHIALNLLKNEEIKTAVREKYKYVFVDEYQDVNPLQEEILSLIGGENIFLVGDGKQAIYGFRGGKSIYFTQKTKEYGEGALDLDRNFRSAREILSFVNEVFEYSMTEKSSGIKYQDMTYGGRYGEAAGYVKIYRCVSDEEKREADEVYDIKELDLSSVRPSEQTKRVYSIINNCVNAPALGYGAENGLIYSPETGKMRRVEYGDIAILSRNDDDSLKDTIAYLTGRGVPVVSLSEINVCDYPEVKMILGVLEYIDNPAQDIPLCTAMLSPLGGFTEDELAKIKLFSDNHGGKDIPVRSFKKDLELFVNEGEGELRIKVDDFLSAAKALRIKARTLSAGEIISLLLSVYGFETEILSRSGGLSAMARAERFSAEAGKEESVHEFLDSLERLNYKVTYTENGGENSVKALTIHKSKGLEFPVVIIIGASSAFHSPKKENMCYDEKYGFAPRYYDTEKMIKNRTVFSRYAERRTVLDGIKDELNLFYVAATRAEYALYIVYKGKKKGKSPYLKPNSYMDFVPAETEEKYLVPEEKAEDGEENAGSVIIPSGGEKEEELIRAAYGKEYGYTESCLTAAKSSATALLSEGDKDYYAGEPLVKPIDENDGEEKRSVNAEVNASVGTAYHKFLELADFSENGKDEYERLKGKIPEEYYELLSPTQCEKILSIPKLKELSSARAVKERQFIVSFPANAFTSSGAADDVVYQGAIDLFAYTKNGIELVDYKYSRRGDDDIRKHYAPQLKLYRAALAKILKVAEESICVTVINILSCRAIPVTF